MRGLHGLLSSGAPGPYVSLLSRRSVGVRQAVCGCMWSLRGGNVSTVRVGVRHFAGLCQGTQTRTNPTREKKDHMHLSTHTESAQHHSANTRVADAHGTRVHVASFARNPRRYGNV